MFGPPIYAGSTDTNNYQFTRENNGNNNNNSSQREVETGELTLPDGQNKGAVVLPTDPHADDFSFGHSNDEGTKDLPSVGFSDKNPRFWSGMKIAGITALFMAVATLIACCAIFGTGGFDHAVKWLKGNFEASLGIAFGSGAYLVGTTGLWGYLMKRQLEDCYEAQIPGMIEKGEQIDYSKASKNYVVDKLGWLNNRLGPQG